MSWANLFARWRPRPPLGYLQDRPDSRDKTVAELGLTSGPIASRASVSHPAVKVRHQGSTNSCVGYAVTTALHMAFLRDGRRDVQDLSPRFVYYNARRSYTKYPVDVGTYIREAMQGVIKVGACQESLCPLHPVNGRPSWNAYRYAYQGRGLRGYYRVPQGDTDAVRRALASGHPLVGGWRVDNAFVEHHTPGVVDAIQHSFIGGHAMVICGYSGDRFQLHNSWGTGWREGGKVWVTEDFIAEGYDIWAINT